MLIPRNVVINATRERQRPADLGRSIESADGLHGLYALSVLAIMPKGARFRHVL